MLFITKSLCENSLPQEVPRERKYLLNDLSGSYVSELGGNVSGKEFPYKRHSLELPTSLQRKDTVLHPNEFRTILWPPKGSSHKERGHCVWWHTWKVTYMGDAEGIPWTSLSSGRRLYDPEYDERNDTESSQTEDGRRYFVLVQLNGRLLV